MRLHQLDIESFGPYADPVSIDFDLVSADGLFLIHGPTGSGKTSILDAVCYALYGDLPGNRDKRGIATDHGDGSQPARSNLTFTCADQRLRIRRTGEYQRPKKRGTGTVSVQASVTLERWQGGSWVPLATRHDEVADIINDVLGMGLNQFAQVALLPQGQFATFLQATPEDRRAVLERLFDTSSFAAVETWFANERRRTEATVAGLNAELDAAIKQVDDTLEALGSLDSGTLEAILATAPDRAACDRTRIPEWALAIRAGVQASLSEAVAALDAAALSEQHAIERRDATRDLAERQARAREARESLARLSEQQDERRAIDVALDGHDRAASVAVPLELARLAGARDERAREALATTTTALHALGLGDRAEDVATLASEVARLDSTIAEVESLHAQMRAQEQRRADAATALLSLEANLEERIEAERAAAQRVATLADEADRLRAAEERLPRLVEAVHRAQRATDLERANLVDEARCLEVEDDRRTADAAFLDAREVLLNLRETRLNGMAAELARDLEADQECPVCGALQHPAPAQPAAETVTAEDLSAAELAVDAARAALQEHEVELVELRTRSAERRAELAALGLDGSAAEHVAHAQAELAAAEANAAQLVGATAAHAEALERHAASEVDRAGAEQDLAAARGALAADDEHEAERARRLRSALEAHAQCPCVPPHSGDASADDPGTILRVAGRHAEVADALRVAAAALGEATEASVGATAALEALGTALAQQGFESPDEAESARLADESVADLRLRARRYDDAAAAASATLAEANIAAAECAEPADSKGAEASYLLAREAHQRARNAQAALLPIDRQIQRAAARIARLGASLGPELDRASLVRTLADSVTGLGADNTLRMRLTSFVLASRLERVVAAANERLAGMAASRFVLEHTDGLARRGARSGLGLRVLDQWTDRSRDPSTLSGGETFMVSLALALGLGDAVRQESGGVDLATLFIDEGFGTLDDESLDHVMNTLDDLREGGRAVGVVSHVSDLRTRIARHLEVRKTPAGSSVHAHTPEAQAPAA